jgi:signal transduction histidine kinase
MEFNSITKLIDKITQSVKKISSGLRPEALDELGIVDSIRWQAVEFEKKYKIKCSAFLSTDSFTLDRNQSIALFRIVQETLTNAARHSKATEVEIHLEPIENLLFLIINDNGVGIDPARLRSSKSLGIIGLRERVRLLNGKLDIANKKNGGTVVSVVIPL